MTKLQIGIEIPILDDRSIMQKGNINPNFSNEKVFLQFNFDLRSQIYIFKVNIPQGISVTVLSTTIFPHSKYWVIFAGSWSTSGNLQKF